MKLREPTANQRSMGAALRAAARRVAGVVVNTDSDGLISALLVAEIARAAGRTAPPLVGFYDNERLWLAPHLGLPQLLADPTEVLFLDADVRLRGAVVVSQHVVHHPAVQGLAAPPEGVTLLNPNYLDVARDRPYRWKYPFSTAAWIWALAPEGLPHLGPATPLLTGLLWAQDGGHESVAGRRFRSNCLEWALELVEDMPLAQAAMVLKGLSAEDRVGPFRRDEALIARARDAERELKRLIALAGAPAAQGWQSQQWCFAARQRSPVADPATSRGRGLIVAFLNSVGTLLGLDAPVVEEVRLEARGCWHLLRLGERPPHWPAVFSAARTYTDRVAYTERMAVL